MIEEREKQDSVIGILAIISLAILFALISIKDINNTRKKSEDMCLNTLRYQAEFNIPIPDKISEFCFRNGYYK